LKIEDRIMEYVDSVQDKKVLTCKWVKLAVKRFVDDLERIPDEAWPYTFDLEKAERVIAFVEALKQYQDRFAGQYLTLTPWQVFTLSNIYGWVRKDNGHRRFTTAFIFVGRKNGKTMFVSALAPYSILLDNGGEVYIVATKSEQSGIAYRNMVSFIKQNEGLNKRLKVYKSEKKIKNPLNESFIKPVSRDTNNDGFNPSFVIADECAAMKDWGSLNVMLSGMGAREQPLTIEITTGGENTESVGMKEFEVSKDVLQGKKKADNFFTILYTLDDGDDWKDPKNYIKANPNLGVSIQMDSLVRARDDAILQPYKENEFKAKNLNLFVSSSTLWISDELWGRVARKTPPAELKGLPCAGGLDLSKVSDLTAYTLYFRLPDKRRYAKHRFYIPEKQIDRRFRDEAKQIRLWIKQGYITTTDGETVNYDVLFRDIMEDMEQYNFLKATNRDTNEEWGGIGYDPWNAQSLSRRLIEAGAVMHRFDQNLRRMSPALKAWEMAVINGEIIDPNPVMRWMVSCAAVKRDDKDNIFLKKDAAGHATSKRIDGVVSSVIAHQILANVPTISDEEIQASVAKAIDLGTQYGY
jgi:phage terminase large subunit-like protein